MVVLHLPAEFGEDCLTLRVKMVDHLRFFVGIVDGVWVVSQLKGDAQVLQGRIERPHLHRHTQIRAMLDKPPHPLRRRVEKRVTKRQAIISALVNCRALRQQILQDAQVRV